MTSEPLSQKRDKLFKLLEGFKTLAIAFSGGIDSTLLLAASQHVLGSRAVAMTACSPIHAAGEKKRAVSTAQRLGARHMIFNTDELSDPNFAANEPDRCYHCKKHLLATMKKQAREIGCHALAHGANVDDLSDHRPGMKAAVELDVAAPLLAAGFSKTDIRRLAREWGLPEWNLPADACLATRVTYGIRLDSELMRRIDAAEQQIRKMAISRCRVRHHGTLARIEVDPGDIAGLVRDEVRLNLTVALKELGYQYICIDMEGYISGKMNRQLIR